MMDVLDIEQRDGTLPDAAASNGCKKPSWIIKRPLADFPWKFVRMVPVDPIQAALSDAPPTRTCISLEAFCEYFSMDEQFAQALVGIEKLELVMNGNQPFVPIDSALGILRMLVELVSEKAQANPGVPARRDLAPAT